MHVLYLIFNEGYTTSSGEELYRVDLSHEAIRLTRKLYQLIPQYAEDAGLLALMLLTDARRTARAGPMGELIPLDEQDRTLWDAAMIQEGTYIISAALTRGAIGVYQIQAAIAALHDEAKSTAETDWAQIATLYKLLQRISPSPMSALSEAIAESMVHGVAFGLSRIEALAKDPRLQENHRLYAAWAHLLARAERKQEAIEKYQRAASLTINTAERNYLLTHAAKLCE
jgi:predicted RNA polymerase sigma factor